MKPITDRQRDILRYLLIRSVSYGVTPAEIARGIGITRGPRRQRGPWSGYQSPAQYIIGSLTGLSRRGYINLTRRPDGLSGTAYTITREGREALDGG